MSGKESREEPAEHAKCKTAAWRPRSQLKNIFPGDRGQLCQMCAHVKEMRTENWWLASQCSDQYNFSTQKLFLNTPH